MATTNTSASGNVTVTFTKEEWAALKKLSQLKTVSERRGENFIAEDEFGHSTSAAYAGGLFDGEVNLVRQIVGDAARSNQDYACIT